MKEVNKHWFKIPNGSDLLPSISTLPDMTKDTKCMQNNYDYDKSKCGNFGSKLSFLLILENESIIYVKIQK